MNLRPLRVLVVEDDPVQRMVLETFLTLTEGVTPVGRAEDGLTGLALAWELRPDLILLDLVLPGISGLELLRRYRRGGGKASVLVISGVGSPRLRGIALASGADFFLDKPLNYGELAADIRQLCVGVRGECVRLLEEMGVKKKTLACRQTAACAAAMAREREELLKAAYLEVAGEFKTSVGCVEKNVRKLIERLHEENCPQYQKVLALTGSTGRPVNSVFLKALAQAATIPL